MKKCVVLCIGIALVAATVVVARPMFQHWRMRSAIAKLEEQNKDARLAAIQTLGQMGPDATAAVPTLMATLKDDRRIEVRRTIFDALRKIDSDAINPAVLVVVRDFTRTYLLQSPERRKEAQRLTIDFLRHILDEAVPVLIEALHDEKHRAMSARVLGGIGPDAKDAVPALIEALESDLRYDGPTRNLPNGHYEVSFCVDLDGDAIPLL